MRFFLLMAAFGLLAVVFETTWLVRIPTETVHFDFILVAVAALAFTFEWRRAIPVIVFYGILMDLASSGPFGMSIFSYVVIYGFIRAIIAKISFQTGPALVFWVAVVSLLDKVLCSLLLAVSTGELTIPRIIMRVAPLQAVLDAAVGFVLIPFLGWYWSLTWEKITRPRGLVLK